MALSRGFSNLGLGSSRASDAYRASSLGLYIGL